MVAFRVNGLAGNPPDTVGRPVPGPDTLRGHPDHGGDLGPAHALVAQLNDLFGADLWLLQRPRPDHPEPAEVGADGVRADPEDVADLLGGHS